MVPTILKTEIMKKAYQYSVTYSMALVHKQTIPTEQLLLVGEVNANI
jgi:hypothetical protein